MSTQSCWLLLIVTAFWHFVCNLLFTADNQPEDEHDIVSDPVSPVDERQEEEEDPEEEADEAPEEEDNILSITDSMSKMKVASSRYDMSARFPYVLYVYAESRYKVSVDMLVFGVPKKNYRPRVRAGGMFLDVEVEIPNLFLDWRRLLLASNFSDRRTLSRHDHKVVAYKLMAQDIKESSSGQVDIKQSIRLPFQVDEDFCTDDGPGWELQVFNNEGTGGVLAEEENLFILSIDMQSSKKFRNDALEGSVRRIGGKFSQATAFKDSQDNVHRSRAPPSPPPRRSRGQRGSDHFDPPGPTPRRRSSPPRRRSSPPRRRSSPPRHRSPPPLRQRTPPHSIGNTPSVEEEFYDANNNGNGKAWGGGFEPTTPRKRKTLNHDAGGVFGRDLMQHLTEDEITEIERKTATDVMELESDFDEDEDEVVYTNGNLARR
jgi:hypothetical protein